MCVEERILMCRLLEKMQTYEVYGKKLGLQDASRMHGIEIGMKIEKSNGKLPRKDRD